VNYYEVQYTDYTAFTFKSPVTLKEFTRRFVKSYGFVTASGAIYNTKNYISIRVTDAPTTRVALNLDEVIVE
jgi:hypothetical protein